MGENFSGENNGFNNLKKKMKSRKKIKNKND